MDKREDKTSDFIEKHTQLINNEKRFNILEAMIELHARVKSSNGQTKNILEALSDYGQFAIDIEKRVAELEGKKTIEIISPDQFKGLIK